MNRPIPRLILKVERGNLCRRAVSWLSYDSIVAMQTAIRDLLYSATDAETGANNIVRITSIAVWDRDGRAIKITSYTSGEHPWHFAHYTAQQCKFKSLRSLGAAFAVLPKEVLDEATRSAQS